MAGSASGQDDANSLRSDWLPERTRWACTLSAHMIRISRFVPAKAKLFGVIFWPDNKSFIDQAKLVQPRWLDIGLTLFLHFSAFLFVSVHKNAKKELGQYPVILTSHLVKTHIS